MSNNVNYEYRRRQVVNPTLKVFSKIDLIITYVVAIMGAIVFVPAVIAGYFSLVGAIESGNFSSRVIDYNYINASILVGSAMLAIACVHLIKYKKINFLSHSIKKNLSKSLAIKIFAIAIMAVCVATMVVLTIIFRGEIYRIISLYPFLIAEIAKEITLFFEIRKYDKKEIDEEKYKNENKTNNETPMS